jgi:hypothetical protein
MKSESNRIPSRKPAKITHRFHRRSKNISEIEDSILAFISEEDAFRLVIGVIRAAKSNAFSAIDMKNSNFSSIQKIRQMAFIFVTTQEARALEIIEVVLNDTETNASVTAYLQQA